MLLFDRYKDGVQGLCWEDVWKEFKEFPATQRLIDLILSLPASSAEAERSISRMKLTKTDTRSKLTTETLNLCMRINMLTPNIRMYNPEQAIQH